MTTTPPVPAVPDNKISLRYDSSSRGLDQAALRLLDDQQKTWQRLAEGVRSMEAARERRLRLEETSVRLQFNPVRIVSTSADVDPKIIRERRCFLCVPHLPEEQKGILVWNEFLVLCNPAPIFRGHFTVSHVEHRPQQIRGNIRRMLELARAMSPSFTIFYNGPRCGASAPDHLHFQATPTGAIPIERDATDERFRRLAVRRTGVMALKLAGIGRGTIVFEGTEAGLLEQELEKLLSTTGALLREADEPMVNILCSYASSRWRLIIFPRRKHRPDAFFRKGEDQVLISPAAVDIGGLVITPLERDFIRTDPSLIAEIFREVSVDDSTIEKILEAF